MPNNLFSIVMRTLILTALAIPVWFVASVTYAQDQILVGVLAASAGQTERRGETGQFKVIATGDQIFLNDEIRTAENSRIQILLMDETTFSMGADSAIVVDEFIYDPASQTGTVSANIKKGVFRFISGRIAKKKPENMKVTAGNAVISIRGTEVIGTVGPEQSTIVLLSGLIDMTSISAGCGGGTSTAAGCQSSLTRPGFGVAMSAGGQFSPPTRFDPEDIDAVIDSIETAPEEKEDEQKEEASDQQETTEDDQSADETSSTEDGEPAEETTQESAETETQTETNTPAEPEAEVETDANGEPKTEDTPTEETPIQLAANDEGENLAPDGTEKIEDAPAQQIEAKTKEPSKFDLIVLRSFGLIDDQKEEDKTALTETMADVSTNLIDDKKEEDNPATSEPDTRENVENDVDNAVEKLDDEKKEEEQKSSRDETESDDGGSSTPSNTAPTLTALNNINFEDTDEDDSFSTNSANANGNDADGDSIEYSINDMQADTSRNGFTHSTDGSFGKLFINKSTGAYAFVPDDSAIENLKSDTSESFTLTVDDGRDNAQETLTIVVTGVNDTPVLSALTSVLIEDTGDDDSFSTTSANLDASDRDDTALTYSLTDANTSSSLDGYDRSLAGDYGTLHLNSETGAYTYVPDDSAIEGTSTTVTEDFTLNVRDGSDYARQTLTVEVIGANDTPELATLSGISFTDTNADDSFSTANASLSGSDRDTGASLSYGADGASADTSVDGYTHAVAGDYGTLYLNSSNGDYRYVPDDEAIEELTSSASDAFTLSVTDGSASATQTLTASIAGANDTPVLSSISSLSFEDTAADNSFSAATDSLSASDRDSGQSLTYSITGASADDSIDGYTHALAGDYGTLYINETSGAFSYVPNDAAIEEIKSDQTDSFTLTASDGTASASQTLTANITGANDTPVLSISGSNSFTDTSGDDSLDAASLTVTSSDRDNDDLTFSVADMTADTSVEGYTHAVAGSYGTLYINNTSGANRYVPNDTAMEEAKTTQTEDFTLVVSDGTTTSSATISNTIIGVNDTPTLAALTGISITDTSANDTFTAISAALSASDRDDTSFTYSATNMVDDASVSGFDKAVAGDYGTLYLNSSNGDYRYVPDDEAIEELTSSASDAFILSVTDGSASATQTLTASIAGANDTPVLSSISSLSFEDTAADNSFSAATDSLSASDRDSGQSLTYSITGASADDSVDGYTHALAGDYGTLYLNSNNGDYRYAPDDAAIEGLSSTNASDEFTITVTDGTASATQTLTANVTGANDTPILNAASGFSFTDTANDDSFSTATAALDASDADTDASLTYGLTDGVVNTSITFACGGQTCSSSHARTGTYGTLYLDETTGAYAYVPNDSAIEKTSSSVSEDFTLTVSDGTSSVSETVTASVVGVNDTPTMASLAGLTITDTSANDTFSATTAASISASDRDGGQTLSYGINSGSSDTSLSDYTHSLEGDFGRLYLNATSGAYTYVPDDSTVNSLTGTETDTFTLSVTDGSATVTQTLTATVEGVNDIPTLASIATITLTDTNADDSFSATTASLDGADRDSGQSLTYALEEASEDTSQSGYTHSRAGDYGTLYIEASTGDYTYIPNDSAIEALSSGTVGDSFNLTVSDGSLLAGQTLQVNVTGVNDTPELDAITGISFADTIADERFSVTNSSFSGSDRDRGDNIVFTIDGSSVANSGGFTHVKQTSYGQLYYNETTGAYRFLPADNLINAASANVSEQITVNVTDGTASSSQNLAINISGVDDRPIISTETIESQNVSSSGYLLSVTDAESHTITDISSSLPAWLTFRNNTVNGEVQYFWEVGENSPAWLNGSATVNLQAEANGLASEVRNATFVFTCGSDLCDNFIQSSDAQTPRQVTDSSDQLNQLKIDGEEFEYFKTSDIDELFNSSRSNTGQFRVVYTANEANGGDGVWSIDQTVVADYLKREITVNGTVDVENLTYFDGASDSFSYSTFIDFSTGQDTYQTGLYWENAYSNSDDFTGYEMVNEDGQTVNLYITDYVGYLNDMNGNNASVIYSSIQTLSSNPAGYNENFRHLVEREWRVLEPQ